MHGHADYRVRYVQAYIHYRKHVNVKINRPRNQHEDDLLNRAYVLAKQHMNQIGKSLHV